jgi:hypothetical protein
MVLAVAVEAIVGAVSPGLGLGRDALADSTYGCRRLLPIRLSNSVLAQILRMSFGGRTDGYAPWGISDRLPGSGRIAIGLSRWAGRRRGGGSTKAISTDYMSYWIGFWSASLLSRRSNGA